MSYGILSVSLRRCSVQNPREKPVQEGQPIRTPQESADHLADALDENTTALNRLKRRYRLTLLFIAALFMAFGFTLKFNYDGNVGRCQTGNELRAEINEKFQKLTVPLDAGGVGDTPQGQELLITLREDLTPNDCSSINWLGR